MNGFDTAERLAIVEEWKRQAAAWKPKQGYAYGCLMILGALVLGGVVTALHGAAKAITAVLVAVLGIGGFLVMQTRVLPGDPRQIADDACALLAAGSGDAESRRRAAVALLFHAWDQRGPTMSTGYDHDAVRAKIRSGLAYLQAVEQVLSDELRIAPTFAPPPTDG